jgi:uncharacterized protein (DUF58 family)
MFPWLPSVRLAALVGVAGVAFLWSPEAAGAMNLVLLALVVRDGIHLARLPVPEVERRVTPRVELGETVPVELSVTGTAGLRLSWTDDPGPGLRREPPEPGSITLAAEPFGRGEGTDGYRLRGEARGPTHLGAIHLRILGPLGLLWRAVRIERRDPVTVQPGIRALRERRLPGMRTLVAPGSHRVRFRDGGREFARLREYVRGDDPRRVDWKATARKGHLVVREYEAERSQNLVIAVDAGRLMTEGIGNRSRLDHALAAALLLADAARGHGDQVGLLLFADTVQRWVPPGGHTLSAVADHLARVEGRPAEPDYPAAFRLLARDLRRRSLVVLFTDVVDPRSSRTLLAHLARSARQHLPVLVAIRNPELDRAAFAPAGDPPGAYRRAAAEELVEEREVALRGLRRRGVLVADVLPDQVLGAALERYAEVKRRGLL